MIGPYSWRSCLGDDGVENAATKIQIISPSHDILTRVVLSKVEKKEIILGAGCFWHVEFALRRLPGVIDTKTGYAGGELPNPTYKDICNGKTGHAEVVKVVFDPTVCNASRLIDCWLTMHDPTIVRAHGKRAKKTGQYRSCVFVFSDHMQNIASNAVETCQQQLGEELSSEVKMLAKENFWAAEERHQRHDELRRGVDLDTLSFGQWLLKYGRRSAYILGSSESIQVEDSDDDLDDGMARMMI
jgi:peptide-methionine (S)-S-oxide reductase